MAGFNQPNIIRNLKYAFLSEYGYDSPLTDDEIASCYEDNYFSGYSPKQVTEDTVGDMKALEDSK